MVLGAPRGGVSNSSSRDVVFLVNTAVVFTQAQALLSFAGAGTNTTHAVSATVGPRSSAYFCCCTNFKAMIDLSSPELIS